MIKEEIINAVSVEFERQMDLFDVLSYNLADPDLYVNDNQAITSPGVFAFIKDNRLVRVGRSFSNTRKRAFINIEDNTGGIMSGFANSPDVELMLFNLKDCRDKSHFHCIAALDVYLEFKFNPVLPSKRIW